MKRYKGKLKASLIIAVTCTKTFAMKYFRKSLQIFLLSAIITSCKSKSPYPSTEAINQLNLKRGEVISCGPPEEQFGSVDFEMTCNEKEKKAFNLAIELLHSFEYDEAEKVFAKVIDEILGLCSQRRYECCKI